MLRKDLAQDLKKNESCQWSCEKKNCVTNIKENHKIFEGNIQPVKKVFYV